MNVELVGISSSTMSFNPNFTVKIPMPFLVQPNYQLYEDFLTFLYVFISLIDINTKKTLSMM